MSASKEGYKTITKKIQFGVIEKEADIDYTEVRDTVVQDIEDEKDELIKRGDKLLETSKVLLGKLG